MNSPYPRTYRLCVSLFATAILTIGMSGLAKEPSQSQRDARQQIETVIERNLKAGKLYRQPAYPVSYSTSVHTSQSIVCDEKRDGVVIGVSFAIEEDLGCGCCFGQVGTDIGDDQMIVVAHLSELQQLDLRGTQVTHVGLRHLLRLNQLRQLSLQGQPIIDSDLDVVARMTSLQELDLSGTKVTDAGLRKLAALPHLRFLNYASTPATGEGLDAFHNHTELRWAPGGPKTRKALAAYKNISGIEKMHVVLNPTTEPDGDSKLDIQAMPKLKTLSVESATPMPLSLKQLPELEELNVGGLSLNHLSNTPLLRQIWFRGVMNQTVAQQLSNAKSLADLSLDMQQGSELASLDLAGNLPTITNLTIFVQESKDDVASHLRLPPQLTSFYLNSKNVGLTRLSELLNQQSSLQKIGLTNIERKQGEKLRLEGLRELKQISLSHTNVEQATFADLQQLSTFDIYDSQIDVVTLRGVYELPMRSLSGLLREKQRGIIGELRLYGFGDDEWTLQSSPKSKN